MDRTQRLPCARRFSDSNRTYTRPPVNRKSLGCLLEIGETILLTVIVFLVIQGFVVQPYRVEQISMQNTLQDGQMVLVDKLTPRTSTATRAATS